MSRYGSGTGAFLLPVYGGGELPQAFCRVAAVAGAVYVLRQGIGQFLLDANTGLCRALNTSSGQVNHGFSCIAAREGAYVREHNCRRKCAGYSEELRSCSPSGPSWKGSIVWPMA